MASPLTACLLGFLAEDRRAEVTAIADLEDVLRAQVTDGARTWASVTLAEDGYLRVLADALHRRRTEPAERVLRTVPASDLYLAAACAQGVPAAVEAFRDEIMPVVRSALGKLRLAETIIDETEQRVLIMVLVGDPVRPAIATFSGRGQLRSWVKSIAVRTGRRLAGVADVPVEDASDELDRLSANVSDPELALLRERYRDDVRAALASAFGELAERARNVLRQYYIDGLTIDQLAALYRVDRATTARWVIAARTAVLDGTRDRLRAAFGATTTEVESILRLVQSQLELSLRLLD